MKAVVQEARRCRTQSHCRGGSFVRARGAYTARFAALVAEKAVTHGRATPQVLETNPAPPPRTPTFTSLVCATESFWAASDQTKRQNQAERARAEAAQREYATVHS